MSSLGGGACLESRELVRGFGGRSGDDDRGGRWKARAFSSDGELGGGEICKDGRRTCGGEFGVGTCSVARNPGLEFTRMDCEEASVTGY